ncbi:MAG: 2-hydroxycarboxylate transporter family protein [Ralstonia sp.]|nr:2-hydroxycarboxylate transporter family protein [Ralstonia pickettii]MCL6469797.1 2-hydroxycarboxylate transporter family protein [Ralstonia sp.]
MRHRAEPDADVERLVGQVDGAVGQFKPNVTATCSCADSTRSAQRWRAGTTSTPSSSRIGGAAILRLFAPSALVGYKVIDPEMLKALTTPMKTANLQYLYIARSAGATSVGRFF